MIMTSVDLTRVISVSPTLMPVSSTLWRVITLSMSDPPGMRAVIGSDRAKGHFFDRAGELIARGG